MLAEIAGNRVLERMVGELVTRTSLIIGMFGEPGTDNCRLDEHDRILKAIRSADEGAGAKLMFEHLAHIEAGLDVSGKRSTPSTWPSSSPVVRHGAPDRSGAVREARNQPR